MRSWAGKAWLRAVLLLWALAVFGPLRLAGRGALGRPAGLAFPPDGARLAVTDFERGEVLVLRLSGLRLEAERQIRPEGLKGPRGVTWLSRSRLAVCDPSSHRVFLVSIDGRVISAVGPKVGLKAPQDVVVDPRGRLLVSDAEGRCVYVLECPGGRWRAVSTIGGRKEGVLSRPAGISLHPERGLLFVADRQSGRVSIFRYDVGSGTAQPAGGAS